MIRLRSDLWGYLYTATTGHTSQLPTQGLIAQLREIQQVAGVGSWRIRMAGTGFFWSDEICRLLGFEPETVGQSVGAFLRRLHREDHSRVVDAIRIAIRQSLSLMLVFRVRWPDRELHYLRVRGRLEPDETGSEQWIGTVQDVTESKRAEQERGLMFEQVCAGRERMQVLSHRLLQVPEAKRRAIARDLHDEIGQELTALRISLAAA